MAVVFVSNYDSFKLGVWDMVVISAFFLVLLHVVDRIRDFEEEHDRDSDVVEVFERWEELIMGLEKLLRCLLSVTVWKWIGVECSGRVYRMDPGTAFTFPFALSIWTYLLRSERNPLRAPVQR